MGADAPASPSVNPGAFIDEQYPAMNRSRDRSASAFESGAPARAAAVQNPPGTAGRSENASNLRRVGDIARSNA